MNASTPSVASTQASMVKTIQSSRKSFATSISSTISSLAGSITSGIRSIASIFTFPVSYIGTRTSNTKEGEKTRKVKLRIKHPKWMKLIDWFVMHSPPATVATTTESTATADPEKNAANATGNTAGATATGQSTTGQPANNNDKEATAEGIKRGEEIIALRAKEQEERYKLALAAAQHFKQETDRWRAQGKMAEEAKKAAESSEELKYGDIFKANPNPPVQTGDQDVDAKTNQLTNRIAMLVQGANYYKAQLNEARGGEDPLKDDALKAKLNHEQLYYGNLFK